MMRQFARLGRLVFGTILIACAGPPAQAQTYPSKPIRIILPYVPGGIIDTAGRHLALG